MSASPQAIAPKETVYSGPAGAGTINPNAGTVYDPSRPRVNKAVNSSVARTSVTQKTRRASVRFFVVSALSFAEFAIYRETQPTIAMGALAIAIGFLIIGFFALRLSRGAFLAAMIFYALDTLLLIGTGMSSDLGFFFVAKPLFFHAIVLYRLYKSYELLGDLHDLENQPT